MNVKIIILIFVLIAFSSCKPINETHISNNLKSSNCNQNNVYNYNEEDLPTPFHQLNLPDVLKENFSLKSLNMSNAIGVLDLLENLLVAKSNFQSNPSLENKVEILEISQLIYQKINIASIEVSAIASEIDCEEERAEQIANYLKTKENKKSTNLTVGAIVLGASGAIATALLINSGNLHEYVGIGTAFTEATLGLLILLNEKKANFEHPRNMLSEVYKGESTSDMFPPSIWYYLNYKDNNDDSSASLRELLVDKWQQFNQTKKSRKNQDNDFALIFSAGGTYTSEQLFKRSEMYDQLESHVNLMKQDLKNLSKEIEQILY